MRQVVLIFMLFMILGATTSPTTKPVDARFSVVELLFKDEFDHGSEQWTPELEKGGSIEAKGGVLDIDVPGGCTLWFRQRIDGPVLVEYEATAISAGGPNDRVSDVNCFWMARDARSPDDIFATKRSGVFAAYNQLKCYYVGLGGNSNTTTRFRRYIGDAEQRPLLPEHDLRDKADLLVANTPQKIRLIACGSLIQYWRDEKRVFELADADPYPTGWFAFRTVNNHMQVRHFRVFRLKPN